MSDYLLVHQCVCSFDWEQEYDMGDAVDPECPSCGRGLELIRPKRKAAYESISSRLVK